MQTTPKLGTDRSDSEPSTLYLLHQSGQAVRSTLEDALRPLGMTGVKYTILSIVARGGASSADISRRLFVTPQTMGEIVASLIQRGLIARRADGANRRVLRLHITSDGQQTLTRCNAIAKAVEARTFETFSPAERKRLRSLLQRLLVTVREEGDAAPSSRKAIKQSA